MWRLSCGREFCMPVIDNFQKQSGFRRAPRTITDPKYHIFTAGLITGNPDEDTAADTRWVVGRMEARLHAARGPRTVVVATIAAPQRTAAICRVDP